MELVLDTSDTKEIRELCKVCTVTGVTTNPKIIIASGEDPMQAARDVIACLDEDQLFFMQVVAEDFEGIMKDARLIAGLRPKNAIVKIPVTPAGLQAIKVCREEGIRTLGTVVFTPEVGLMAALNGAEYLAPYVNRMSMYADGVDNALRLINMLDVQGLPTKVMGASFHNVQQVRDLMEGGIQAVTLPPAILHTIVENPTITATVQDFTAQWRNAYGTEALA